ncbi:sigma-70 family RNA polymerase sigma factor [Ferruginibacter paludis]|uniref:RNA polymerase sigma factor n=1 Tax=Ferruginibacter paludis TaxID=1310417 RepID=UPI0025B5F587|nr:sigma-70 family RNA polymerase sigma factor [Ferruginibacter paludis]MDN3659023.1 sigma-70 family RNA polymerase sigma factor [Ferruginibacter paludis]
MEDVLTISPAMSADRNTNITHIIKSMSKRLLGFIKKRVASPEDAEDILQDVFYQFAGSTEPINQASSWLFKVATNKITDSYRKKKLPLADDIFTPASTEEDSFDWKEILLQTDTNPETEYLRNIFWDELQLALNELPAEQRDVFIEHEMNGVSFKEIEAATGVSVATLISRKRYAVLHLRERLQILKDELLNY